MTDPTLDYPCVLFALSRESHFFRRAGACRRLRGVPFRAFICRIRDQDLVVVETGIGAARAESALRWAFSRPLVNGIPHRPRLVISAGFAGALRDGMQVGDVVIATEVTDLKGNHWKASWKESRLDSAVAHRGCVLTTSRLVGDPVEKRRLGETHDAVAVDMETAAIARTCADRNVPWGCVRAISDAADTALSARLVSLLSAGRASPFRVLAALASSPRLTGDLWRLARHTRHAARRLAGALETIVASWTTAGQ